MNFQSKTQPEAKSSSGAVILSGGFWSYSFGSSVGFSKVYQIADLNDFDMPDKIKDAANTIKNKIRSINENSSENQMMSLFGDV